MAVCGDCIYLVAHLRHNVCSARRACPRTPDRCTATGLSWQMGTGSREWTGPWRKTSRVSCALDAGEQYCNGNMRHPARRRKSSLQSGVLYFRLRDALPPTTSTTTVWSCSFFRPFAARERANRNPGFRPGEVGMSTTWSTGELMRHQSQRPHARSAISYSTAHSKSVQSLLAQSIYGVTRYDDASAQYRVLVHQSPPVHTAPEAGSVQ